MRFYTKLNLIGIALIALIALSVSTNTNAISTTSPSTATSRDNDEYLAPLYNDCREDDPKCGIKEGSYIVSLHGFYRISSHIAFLERTLQRDPTVNWQARWYDDPKSADYTVQNVTQEELEAIRKDPGVYEVEQSYWFEVDTGWDLPCRAPGLSEERKRLCYEEIDVAHCEKSWLTEEEKKDCWIRTVLPICGIEDFPLTAEEEKYCSENRELWDGEGYEQYDEL
ncbi:hypothetical protein KCU98_g15943, partial [Aureobasidium melanogenum]